MPAGLNYELEFRSPSGDVTGTGHFTSYTGQYVKDDVLLMDDGRKLRVMEVLPATQQGCAALLVCTPDES